MGVSGFRADSTKERLLTMQLQRTLRNERAAITLLVVGVLGAMAPSMKADEMPIFGEISGVSCHGAGDHAFPGFAVSMFSFGDVAASTAAASGQVSGKPTFQEITVTKGLDDCTPLLFQAVAQGTMSANATVTVVSKGGKGAVLVIQLENVIVTSDKFTEGAAKELDEVITLSYRKITITHVPSGQKVMIDVATLGVS